MLLRIKRKILKNIYIYDPLFKKEDTKKYTHLLFCTKNNNNNNTRKINLKLKRQITYRKYLGKG